MTNRIMEKALGYGFKTKLGTAKELNPDNLKAVARALTDIISEEDAVMPHAEIDTDWRSDDWRNQRSLLNHINDLSRVCDQYGLEVKTVRQALADGFGFPIKEVQVRNAGQGSKIFYQDEKLLPNYLRERFEEPETTRTFKKK